MLRLLNFRCSFCSNPLDETHSPSPAAVSSHLTAIDAPQSVYLHRWDPDELLPLRLARPPQ